MTLKKKIRSDFRNAVFSRDGHECVFCNCREDLDPHHITDRNLMPNGGYVASNGITLCPQHHLQAEGGSPASELLYEKIGSSYATAYRDSEELGEVTVPSLD